MLLAAAALTALASTAGAQPAFHTIPGGLVYGVSRDGTTALGIRAAGPNGPLVAARWREATGWELLGGVPEPFVGQATAYSASWDGNVVVGRSIHSGLQRAEAFRWTPETGMVGLGDLPGGIFSSGANDVSADGSVVVGAGVSITGEAFRWTAQTGLVPLRPLQGQIWRNGNATGVSADGSVVAGWGEPPGTPSPPRAFRWTQETGLVSIGSGGRATSMAHAISADGSTIVGATVDADGDGVFYEAFRWSEQTGFVHMGRMPQFPHYSAAVDVSADGSVIVGDAGSPFVWTQEHGMRYLFSILIDDFGVDLTGFDLGRVHGISDDGRTIVGTGTRLSTGIDEGWIAVIPAPGTAAAGLAAACLLASRRRR